MQNRISEKVVVITGASSGIGAAAARHLAAAGAKVVLGARRAEALEAQVAAIDAAGGVASHRVTDVTVREDVEALVAAAVEAHGRVDVMVNNAGVALLSRIDQLRVEEWDRMIDVNLRGPLHGIAAALPRFQAQGSGHVVNVVSTSGLRIVPLQGIYAATKNAVRTWSEALRQEVGGSIRVTMISPGYVRTELADNMSPELAAAAREQMDAIGIEPDAVARAIAFAIDQPPHVDVGSVVIRPTAQS